MKPVTPLRCRMKYGLGYVFLFVGATVAAEALPPPARAEIDALLAGLEKSGCEFQRNGKWHGAREARTHLLRKLAYLEDKSLVRTTEQFIELGASASSSSGKPYMVRCGTKQPVESKRWLLDGLKALRTPPGAGSR
jgi:hypothetical protein